MIITEKKLKELEIKLIQLYENRSKTKVGNDRQRHRQEKEKEERRKQEEEEERRVRRRKEKGEESFHRRAEAEYNKI